jgi:hypothetical protein
VLEERLKPCHLHKVSASMVNSFDSFGGGSLQREPGNYE